MKIYLHSMMDVARRFKVSRNTVSYWINKSLSDPDWPHQKTPEPFRVVEAGKLRFFYWTPDQLNIEWVSWYKQYCSQKYSWRKAPKVDKKELIRVLRAMDVATVKADEEGDAECVWFYWRGTVENVLGVPKGTLDASKEYAHCDNCHYDNHRCAACGDPVPHGFPVCIGKCPS